MPCCFACWKDRACSGILPHTSGSIDDMSELGYPSIFSWLLYSWDGKGIISGISFPPRQLHFCLANTWNSTAKGIFIYPLLVLDCFCVTWDVSLRHKQEMCLFAQNWASLLQTLYCYDKDRRARSFAPAKIQRDGASLYCCMNCELGTPHLVLTAP